MSDSVARDSAAPPPLETDDTDWTPSCPHCGGSGWVMVPDAGAGSARWCDCRLDDVLPRLVAAAGIPPRYRGCTLDNFVESNDQLVRAKTLCRRYVDSFLRDDGAFRETGLVLIGAPGVGKTHLAVAVLQELMRRFTLRGLFIDFTSLIHDIQSTFDPTSADSQHRLLEPVMEAELLVLDELGARKPTPWVTDVLYLVMNGRYTRRLPTLFTTNFALSPGGPAEVALDSMPGVERARESLASRIPAQLVSRLYEMAQPIEIESGDFRREIKVAQHRIP
jgi:DNA replication protein DnaC